MISPCTNKLVYLKKAGLILNVQKTKIMLSGSISSVQFSHSVMSDSLQPYELQHARVPVHHQLRKPTQTHVHCIRRCHPTISSFVIPFSSAFNLSQHQGLFQSQLFASGGQSIGVSASAPVLPMNIQD